MRPRGASARTPAALAIALSAALAFGLVGCGVGVEDRARELEPPAGGTSAVSTPTPAALQTGPIVERIYLVRGDMLVPVERRVPEQPEIEAVLMDLVAGPTQAESDAGLSSALLGSNVIASATVSNGLATVDLVIDTIGETGRTDVILQLGQIVCTLTSRPEITWVRFTRGGKPAEVPNGDAVLVDTPLTAADYSSRISAGG